MKSILNMAEGSTSQLSKRSLQMEESATLRMAQMARDLEKEGKEIINLSLGEPDFDTPQHIKNAAKTALDDGFTKYTPVAGLPELKKAICQKFERDNDLSFQEDQIVVSNGAKQCIANLCMSLINPGDEVLLFAPYWVSYRDIVKMCGGVPVAVPSKIENDFKVQPEELERRITDQTKLLIFSSPCNPTGTVYSLEDYRALAPVLERHSNIYVVSDEIYEYINFTESHTSIGAIKELKEKVITVNGFSKGFAMTGWRLGYMGAPIGIARACSKIQGQFTSGATSFSQKAAIEALLGDMEPTHQMREEFLARRNFLVDALREIPGLSCNVPQGAFYLFPDVSALFGRMAGEKELKNSEDVATYLLQEAQVAVVAGSAFGNDDCIRISYAASKEELQIAVKKIKKAVEEIQLPGKP